MKLDKINLYPIKVTTDFTYCKGKAPEYPMAIIELISGHHHGWGEADLRADIQAEKLKEMAEELMRKDINGPDSSLQDITCDLGHYNAFTLAREGFNIALYDLFGKILGVNASVLLGGLRRKTVPGMPVVDVAAPNQMAIRAQKWVDSGYRFLKIKYRGNPEEDQEALKVIRKSVGDKIRFQIDPNFSYDSTDRAIQCIRNMAPYNVELVEDVHDGDWTELKQIRESVDTKIMIDYQAYWPKVLDVVRNDAADVINLHPKNQGGLDIALKVHTVAQAAGLETAIGSMYLLGVGNTAFQLLGGVIGGERPCEDIGFYSYLNGPTAGEYNVPEDPTVVKEPYPIINGEINIIEKPGLGVEINQQKLEKNCRDVIEIN